MQEYSVRLIIIVVNRGYSLLIKTFHHAPLEYIHTNNDSLPCKAYL